MADTSYANQCTSARCSAAAWINAVYWQCRAPANVMGCWVCWCILKANRCYACYGDSFWAYLEQGDEYQGWLCWPSLGLHPAKAHPSAKAGPGMIALILKCDACNTKAPEYLDPAPARIKYSSVGPSIDFAGHWMGPRGGFWDWVFCLFITLWSKK